ncbi:hypothetical protein Pcinc_034582 [Petrolisthes cinctipes]|uniref:Uncharacterized protein n=1 Tax=Petrolisthes cinctipes TaxID=88211 RepID=A0AAE1EPS3_PETCI|nr:hypothetical protein Pcinc_034582 [Petrolisthes cinctipes]
MPTKTKATTPQVLQFPTLHNHHNKEPTGSNPPQPMKEKLTIPPQQALSYQPNSLLPCPSPTISIPDKNHARSSLVVRGAWFIWVEGGSVRGGFISSPRAGRGGAGVLGEGVVGWSSGSVSDNAASMVLLHLLPSLSHKHSSTFFTSTHLNTPPPPVSLFHTQTLLYFFTF